MNRLFTTCIFILFLSITLALSSTKAPVKLTDEERGSVWFQMGEAAELVYHDWSSAIMYYKESLKFAPNNRRCQHKVAFGYLQLGRYKEAIETYKALLEKAKGFKQGWCELGKAYLSAGNEAEAIAKFKKAIELDAKYADPHLELGVIYETRYQQATDETARETAQKEAKEHYTIYLRFTQEEYGLGAQRAQSGLILLKYGEAVSEAYKAGLEAYEKASRSGKSEAEIHDNFQLAYDKFQRALHLNPDCQEAHYMLGMVYNSLGFVEYNRSEAEAEWKKATQIKQALVELGRLNRLRAAGAETGEAREYYSAAKNYLRKALKLDATYQRAHYELGLVFQNMHEKDKALECWVDANEPDANNIYARESRRAITRLAPNHPLAYHDEETSPVTPEDYLPVVRRIEKQHGGVIEVDETTILNQMCQRIVREADLPYKQRYKVKVLDSKEETAFSAPDGSVYFTQGFLQFVRKNFPEEPIDVNNSVIAFVLAHELHHIVARHTLITDTAIVVLPSDMDDIGKEYFRLGYQRQQEFEADQEGVLYMFKAGYDPGASLRFLETYGKGREVTPDEDHPTYQARIHYLEEYWTNEVKFAYDAFQAGVNNYNKAERLAAQNNPISKELYEKAKKQFERFLRIFDNTKQALNNLGLAYYKLALTETDPPKVWADWRIGLALDPQLALKFKRLRSPTRGPGPEGKKYDEYYLEQAILNFKEALRIDANYTKALLNLSSTQILFGKYADAQATLEQLLALECDERGAAYNNLGVLHCKQGEFDKGLDAFQKALAIPSENKPAKYNLGLAYAKLHKRDEAIATFKGYVQLDKTKNGWVARAKRAIEILGGGGEF